MLFSDSLAQFKIGGPSINIPDSLKSHLKSPYLEENIIDIPSSEQFPLPELDPKINPDMKQLRKSFVEAQLEQIRDSVNISNELSFPIIDHPVIEMGGDFDDLDDFITFKKAVALDYRQKSNNFGFKEPIGVCASPICINPAIPGFHYCSYHILEDNNVDQQVFFKRCSYFDESGQCKTPCSSGLDYCSLHTQKK